MLNKLLFIIICFLNYIKKQIINHYFAPERAQMKKIVVISFLSLSLISLIYSYDQKYIDHISNRWLSSFPTIDENIEKPNQQQTSESLSGWQKFFKIDRFITQIKPLSEKEKRGLSFVASPLIAEPKENIIDTIFVDKMELVKGIENPQLNALAHLIIPHLFTKNGERSAVQLFTQPTAALEQLKARQAIIKEIAHNEQLYKSLQELCQELQSHESSFLHFFEAEDPVLQDTFKKVYWGNWSPTHFNTNTSALELKTRGDQFSAALAISAVPLSIWLNSSFWIYLQGFSVLQSLGYGLKTTGQVLLAIPSTLKNGWEITNQIPNIPVRYSIRLTAAGLAGLYGFSLYKTFMDAKFKADIAKYIQGRMIGVASYVKTMQGINTLINNNAILQKSFAELDHKHPETSPLFNKLLIALNSYTFTGSPSLFSLTGRALACYKIMQAAKKEFIPLLNDAGELEFYLALATLYKKHLNTPAHFAFAEFVTGEKPYLKAKNFWNPLLDANKAVPNSLEFNKHMHSIVLSGPNTGGKSTLLRAMMINIILALTTGLAAADHFVLTPFTKCDASIAVQDSLLNNVSGLKAEVLRAKQLLETVHSLKAGQFAFLILDELFTATSPDQAESLAYDFVKKMAGESNCLFISATHYAKLNSIEGQVQACKNYHMDAITDAQGKVIRYTYLIKEGPSTIKNAEQVAHAEYTLE